MHILFFAGMLITLLNGKTQLLYKKYTFYKHYTSIENLSRWNCTRRPRCNAYVIANDDLVIKSGHYEHNHDIYRYHITKSGKYIKL